MAKDKIELKKEEKKLKAQEKAEKQKRSEAFDRLKPLLYSFVLWAVLMGIVHIPEVNNFLMDFLVDFIVASTVAIGRMLFIPIETSGSPLITVAGYTMKVIFECTAYNFYLFAIALVVFGKWSLKDKLINLLIFIFSIFFLNAARFVIMGYVGKAWPHLFHQVHDYVWTIVFGLVVFILYIWRNDKSVVHD